MKKYTFGAVVTVSIYTEVDAEAEEDARKEAESRPMQGLCHQCAGRDADYSWSLSGELDGEACDINLVQEKA